jgi:hypothetical protein
VKQALSAVDASLVKAVSVSGQQHGASLNLKPSYKKHGAFVGQLVIGLQLYASTRRVPISLIQCMHGKLWDVLRTPEIRKEAVTRLFGMHGCICEGFNWSIAVVRVSGHWYNFLTHRQLAVLAHVFAYAGFVPLNSDHEVIRPAKLWCDIESSAEAAELSTTFGYELVPGRSNRPRAQINQWEPYRSFKSCVLPFSFLIQLEYHAIHVIALNIKYTRILDTHILNSRSCVLMPCRDQS